MSSIYASQRAPLQFYLSGPLPCAYLPSRIERKLFAYLSDGIDANDRTNSSLTRSGFRRSHNILYRPACKNCAECVPVRISAERFKPTRSQRKIMAKNAGLKFELTEEEHASAKLYEIFRQYERERHPDSDMARMTFDEFREMLKEGNVSTRIYSLKGNNTAKSGDDETVGAILVDRLEDGFSAVYSFFKTDTARKSIGTCLILKLIEEARRMNLPYVYLGYWIAAAKKMAYKNRFPALEKLDGNGWTSLNQE